MYISYNFIEELFDIGFLEHLTILDIEGNNIKSLDQIYYLRRNQNLTDVNLKYNPVTKEVAYYQRIQENVPRIVTLDDEEIDVGFFERKTEEVKKLNIVKNSLLNKNASFINENDYDYWQKFIKLGGNEEQMRKWAEEAVTAFEKEPEEDELLVKAIKNYTREKKA